MTTDLVVVIDTNVWISGVFFRRGIPASILRAWWDSRFEIVATAETLAELELKLREKASNFGTDSALVEEWIAYVKTFVRITPVTKIVSGIYRDPNDDKFLAALIGRAEYIVSGDHDLQVLGEYQNVQVLSPRAFAELLEIVPPLTSSDHV